MRTTPAQLFFLTRQQDLDTAQRRAEMALIRWGVAVIEDVGLADCPHDARGGEGVAGSGAEEDLQVVEGGGGETGGRWLRIGGGGARMVDEEDAELGEEVRLVGWGEGWGLGHGAVLQGFGLEVVRKLGEEAVLGLHEPVVIFQRALGGGDDDGGGDAGCGEGEVDVVACYGVERDRGVGE